MMFMLVDDLEHKITIKTFVNLYAAGFVRTVRLSMDQLSVDKRSPHLCIDPHLGHLLC